MNLKDAKKRIEDAKPKRDWKNTLTGGLLSSNPTKTNLTEFEKVVENQVIKLMTEGMMKVKGNVCLGVKVKLPSSLNINSVKEPLELIGSFEKDGDFIGLYKPKSGWKSANSADELK